MPFIQVNVPTSLTLQVKQELVREIVESTHRAVGSDPAIINVVIHELPPANVSVGGNIGGSWCCGRLEEPTA